MIKKLNTIIIVVIVLLIIIMSLTKYREIHNQEKIFNDYLVNLEKNMIFQYKLILKNTVTSSIVFIDSTYNNLYNNYNKILNIELRRILSQIKTLNNKSINSYIKNYKHEFITLSHNKTNSIIYKRIQLNNNSFFISIKDANFNNLFINTIRDFMYKNIRKDNRYTWVNKIINFKGGDNYAIRLIHPNLKNTEGKFLSTKTEDIKGNKPYLEELEGINKNKEHYFKYYFKTISNDKIAQKLTYAKLYKKQNWIIASGIPLLSLEEHLKQRSTSMKSLFKKQVYESLLTNFILLAVIILILLILRANIVKYFKKSELLKHKIAQRLITSERQASTFFNLSINIQVVTSLEGKILLINDSCKQILGYSKEELLGTSIFNKIHPSDKKKVIIESQKLKKGKSLYYFENKYKHKNGKYLTLAWSANLNESKNLIYASAQNITELKNKERIIFQQSKMAAMGEMIENISHQWRQPLSNISVIASGMKLKNELNMLEEKELDEAMSNINSSVQHLSQTINDFRDFYKNDKNKNTFMIKNTFKKTFKLISSGYKNANITLEQNIHEISYFAYENDLIQVLINILNNSKDELIKKGKDELKLIMIEAKITNEFLEIIIKDNAGGISKEILKKIFESHFTTKEDSNGTGIGLYMSKMIIKENMQGFLKAKNVNFRYKDISYYGAEFEIFLPLPK